MTNISHRIIRFVAVLALLVGPLPLASLMPAAPVAAAGNPIQLENQQPGTTAWQIDFDNNGNPLMAANHQIEGYASLTSVNKGGSISFMVSLSTAAQYTMDIYRMGYYAGNGGRLMQHIGPLAGSKQATCPTTTTTTNFGLIECSWTPAYTLTVPTTWTTGNYVVKLTRSDTHLESYMTFVVRDDAGAADIVYSMDVTTWQAYNFWGGAGNNDVGYSLYGKFNDVTWNNTANQRAYAVSFNRPYIVQGETDGAGQFFIWDFPMVSWLEQQGYNVTYVTDVDLETTPGLFTGRKAFVNAGHDEYYSANMRSTIQNGIINGIHMGFFSANDIYYQIRFAADGSGQSNRREICYKDQNLDPTTIRWRDLTPTQPENAVYGVMQNGVANDRAWRVYDSGSWIFSGTGLVNYVSGTPVTSGSGQNAIAGLVGYEFDERAKNDASLSSWASFEPAGLQQVAHSAVPAGDNGVAAFSDSTLFTAPSGAIVFAAGTIQWSFGLADGYQDGYCSGCNPGYTNSKSQQITANILNRYVSGTAPTAPAVTLSPTGLTFSSQTLNTTSAAQSVTLTNTGNAALSISSIGLTGTNPGDYAQTNTCPVSPSTVAAGAGCTINVTFTPTATGTRTASVSISDNASGSPHTVALSGTGATAPAPAVNLNPTSLTFSSQTVNTTSSVQSVTLTNSGNAALSISSIALSGTNAGDFAQSNTCPVGAGTLAAGANCTIGVTFTPTATGTRSASVSITDNAGGAPHTVALSGIGASAPAPAVSLNPTSLTFGSHPVGTTSDAQTVTLTNSGNAALTISGIGVTGSNAGDFAQTNTCPLSPSTLAAGASCTISVTFAPSIAGPESAGLSLSDDASGSPQIVSLSGTGAAPAPVVSLSPSSLSFGSQRTGTTSGAQTVTLTNSGNADLSISSIGLTGSNAGDYSQTNTCPVGSGTLVAGTSCTISVTFTPSATGTRSGSLTMTDNAAGSPQSVALSGTGTAPAVTLSPTSLTFAGQQVNTTSGAQTVTVTNSGTAPLTISSIGITGTNASEFAQTSGCPLSPGTVAAGAKCTISVTFTPAATGTRTATLTMSDDAAGSPRSVAVSGTGSTTSNVLFSDGFESGSLPGAWTKTTIAAGNSLTLDTSLTHSGTASLKAVKLKGKGGNAKISKTLSSGQTTLDVRAYYLLSNPINFGNVPIMTLYAQGNFIGWLAYYADPSSPQLSLYNGANGVTYTCPLLTLNSWHSLEVQYVLSTTTTGSATVWIDGTQACGAGGIKTLPSSGLTLNQVVVGVDSADTTVGLTVNVDDVVVSKSYIGP